MKETCAIYVSFHKMVFCLKDVHVMVWCDHASLHKFIYSVMENGKVNNWSQEIHAITPYIDLKHIKEKENILADSWSWLQTLSLYEVNEPKKEGHKYSKIHFQFRTRDHK